MVAFEPDNDHVILWTLNKVWRKVLDKRREMHISTNSVLESQMTVRRTSNVNFLALHIYVIGHLFFSCHWCNWLWLGHVSNVIERGETSVEQEGVEV